MADNNNNAKQTIVEEGTEFEGVVRSKVPVKVSGAVKGELAAPSLAITETGAVKGQVKVAELVSAGEIAGQIEADSVQLSGKVSDQTSIKAKTLEVKLAQSDGKLQVMFGNVELNVGERAARAEDKPAPAAKQVDKAEKHEAEPAQENQQQARAEKR